MVSKFGRFLGSFSSLIGDKGNLGDYQHAARLFVDDTFRLAPKNKFLYYVVLHLNPEITQQEGAFSNRHRLEVNYLVKSAELPKYTIDTETGLNQYNRKTNSYKKIQYDPVNIKLHDDNNGITNMLWSLYYGYYFRDRLNNNQNSVLPLAYRRNTYASKLDYQFRYGLDNDSSQPFFNSIQIVTLTRQRFFSYLLCNPKITKWDHDSVEASASGDIMESSMTVVYDSVIYGSGVVRTGNPAGFAELHYDTVPSPIYLQSLAIGALNTVSDSVTDLLGLDSLTGRNSRFNSLRRGNNIYQNLGNRNPFGAQSPALFGNRAPRGIGGLQSYTFNNSSNSGGIQTVLGVGAALAVGSVFRPNRAGAINQEFGGSINAPGTISPTTNDVFGPSLPGGTVAAAGRDLWPRASVENSAAEIAASEAARWRNVPLAEAPSNINTASFQSTAPSNAASEILSDSSFFSGTSPFE